MTSPPKSRFASLKNSPTDVKAKLQAALYYARKERKRKLFQASLFPGGQQGLFAGGQQGLWLEVVQSGGFSPALLFAGGQQGLLFEPER